MDKDELNRWGFSKRQGSVWYNSHLCMEINVLPILLNMPLSELDLIYAVYQRGFENGTRSIKRQFKQLFDIDLTPAVELEIK